MNDYYREGITFPELVDLVEEPRSTVDHWVRTGLIQPVPESLYNPKSVGRRFNLRNTQIALTIARLREAGVSLQRIREASEKLKEFDEDLATAVLWTDSLDVYQVGDVGAMEEALVNLNQNGQLVSQEVMRLNDAAKEAREFYEQKTRHRQIA